MNNSQECTKNLLFFSPNPRLCLFHGFLFAQALWNLIFSSFYFYSVLEMFTKAGKDNILKYHTKL